MEKPARECRFLFFSKTDGREYGLFCAIIAHANSLSVIEDKVAESECFFRKPASAEGARCENIAEGMSGGLVETTGKHLAISSDNTARPQSETSVSYLFFQNRFVAFACVISGVTLV